MKKVTIQKKNEMIKVKVAHYTLKEILKTADVVRNLNTQNPIDKRDLNAYKTLFWSIINSQLRMTLRKHITIAFFILSRSNYISCHHPSSLTHCPHVHSLSMRIIFFLQYQCLVSLMHHHCKEKKLNFNICFIYTC